MDGLSEEQRLMIEHKRQMALECRSRHQKVIKQTIPRKDEQHANAVSSFAVPIKSLPVQFNRETPKSGPNKLHRNSYDQSSSVGKTSKKPHENNKPFTTPTNLTHVTCSLSSRTTFEVQAPHHNGLSLLYKNMLTHSYNPSSRRWSFGLIDYHEFVKQAKSLPGIVVDGLPDAVMKTFKSSFTSNSTTAPATAHTVKLSDFLPDDFVQNLLPFQCDGVRFALSRGGRVLLADDMGLGKTVQALALAAAYQSDWPLLIVTPSSVRFAWRDQCLRWLQMTSRLQLTDISVVTSGRDLDQVNQFTVSRITIISYDLMSRFVEQLKMCRFGMIIMDESHFLKNGKTQRTKSALTLLKATRRALLLSGTPAVSRPAELYPQVSGVAPNLFRGGFHEYGLRYCAAKECPWGWDYTGCSNMTELQLILEDSIMIRRTKADVLTQLPAKRRELVMLDPNAIKAGRLKRHAKMMANDNISADAKRSAMLQYFHETASVKLPALQQYVLDLIEVGRKFLLFAHHMEVLDNMSKVLSDKSVSFIRIDGRTNSEQRTVVCKKFQEEDDCLVALLSITAAGTGLNFTAASLVVFAELFWNPGALVQAEDRAYRIGQQDSVLVRYLLAEGTADDFIWSMIEKKLHVLSKAGLSKDTFRTADRTHLGTKDSNTQQSIMNFFTSELMMDDDDEFDETVTLMGHDCASPVFELDNENVVDQNRPPRAGQCEVTNLFSATTEPIFPSADVVPCSGHVIVADTPDTSPSKMGEASENPTNQSISADETCVGMDDCDTFLVEAAIEAEVNWLTDGLCKDAVDDPF